MNGFVKLQFTVISATAIWGKEIGREDDDLDIQMQASAIDIGLRGIKNENVWTKKSKRKKRQRANWFDEGKKDRGLPCDSEFIPVKKLR